MPVELYRIDDRLIHGQVVVGWGQPLNIRLIVLVDDEVACCDWEQDLYRMGVPPEMELRFADVATAVREHASYESDPRPSLILTPDVATMRALLAGVGTIRQVNVGGLHHRPGRLQKLRYVFLSPEEEREIRDFIAGGVKVTAQDVPAARPVPMEEVLGMPPRAEKSA
ncbi:MAG TPA: PTS sugar transporter subunit IIB [Gemmatimonadaceae bacterium]|jgi:PTS system mannose-specific IIB component/fructoselysine and glucoselysine-specific PTS system IIB component